MEVIFRLPNGQPLRIGGQFVRLLPSLAAKTPLTYLKVVNYYTNHPAAEPVYQHRAGTEVRTMPAMCEINAGGNPNNIEARVIGLNGLIVKDWTALQNVSISGNFVSGEIPDVDMGQDYLTQMRDKFNHSINDTCTQKWGVGEVWGNIGQSNMLKTLIAGYAGTIVPGTGRDEIGYWGDRVYSTCFFAARGFTEAWAGTVWNTNEDPTIGGGSLAFLRIVAKTLHTKYGKKIPVAMIPYAINSAGLTGLSPDVGDPFKSGTVSGHIGLRSPPMYSPGDIAGICLFQGEEAVGRSVDSRMAELDHFYREGLKLVAPYGRTAAHFPLIITVLGSYEAFLGVEKIREAAYKFAAEAPGKGWPRVRTGWSCIDLDASDPRTDGMHLTDIPGDKQQRMISMKRLIQDVCHELAPEIVPHSAQGPYLSRTYTRTPTTITLPIIKVPGTTLSTEHGGAPSGLRVHTDEFFRDAEGVEVPCTAALVGDNVVLTGNFVGTVYVKNCGGEVGTVASNQPDISNLIYDDMPYPTGAHPGDQFIGLPLQTTPVSIEVLP